MIVQKLLYKMEGQPPSLQCCEWSTPSQGDTRLVGLNIPTPYSKLWTSEAWWWVLIQTLGILRRQDKCYSHFLFLYGTLGKLGSFIFFLKYNQTKALCARGKKPGRAITLSLMPIWAAWSPQSSFSFFPSSFMFGRQDVWNPQSWVLTLPFISFQPFCILFLTHLDHFFLLFHGLVIKLTYSKT